MVYKTDIFTNRGMFLFVGPVLLLLTTIAEWIMGNFLFVSHHPILLSQQITNCTSPMMVCGLFSVFWLSFGFLLLPTLALDSAYTEGATGQSYNAAIALYLLVWGFVLLMFFVFTLKTNMVFGGIFLFVTLGAWVLSGAYWRVSTGDFGQAGQLQKVRDLFVPWSWELEASV